MKYNYLESFRGLMATWVMIMHGMGFLYILPSNFITDIFYNGFIPVVGFIILSGFVTHILLDKKEKLSFYIQRRFLRLFPIYLFSFIISCFLLPLYKLVLSNLTFENHNIVNRLTQLESTFNDHFILNIISHLGLAHGLFPNDKFPFTYTIMGQSWSLTLEWQFYIFIPFLYGVIYNKKHKLINILIVLIFALSIPFAHYYMPQKSFLPYMIQYFLIGFVSYPLFRRFKEKNNPLLIIFLIIISVYFYFIDWMISGINLIFMLLLILQKYRLEKLNKIFENRYLLKLGKISYSIYCIHMIVFYLLIYLLQKMNLEQNVTFAIITILGGSILTIFLSNLTYKYIEVKFMRLKPLK